MSSIAKIGDKEFDLAIVADQTAYLEAVFQDKIVGEVGDGYRTGIQRAIRRDELQEIARRGLKEIDKIPIDNFVPERYGVGITKLKASFLRGLNNFSIASSNRLPKMDTYEGPEHAINTENMSGFYESAMSNTLTIEYDHDGSNAHFALAQNVAKETLPLANANKAWLNSVSSIVGEYSAIWHKDMLSIHGEAYLPERGTIDREKVETTLSRHDKKPVGGAASVVNNNLAFR